MLGCVQRAEKTCKYESIMLKGQNNEEGRLLFLYATLHYITLPSQ